MDFENIIITYKVYVKIDELNRIIEINSNEFINDLTDWILIDEGQGDKYHHAQNHYLSLPLVDERLIYRYKLVDNVPVERTQEEKDADYVEPEIPESSNDSSYEERITALEEQNATLIAQLEAYEVSYTKGVQDA